MEIEKAEQAEILKNKDRKQKYVRFPYALEPAYFVLYYAFNLTCAVKQNQILKQTCSQKGFTLDDCANNNISATIENVIQPEVARINMSILLLNSIFPSVFSLILGSWSDLYGRKKILIISYIGYSTTLGLIALFSFISDNTTTLTPWMYFFAEMPMTFMGGWPILDIAVTTYVADLSTDKTRSFRLGIVGFLNFSGNALAYFTSSYIVAATNITTVFIIGFSLSFLMLIWVLALVDDSLEPHTETSSLDQFKEIFSTNHPKEIFKSLSKKRSLKCREILWSLIAIPTLIVFTMHGNGSFNYLFVRHKFGWSLREWTTYESINNVLSVAGMFVGITVFKRWLQISDLKLGVLGLLSYTIDAFIKAFAESGCQLYVSSGITLFRLLSMPMFRSLVSIVVSHHEIGKVYSLMTCFGALSGVFAAPFYTLVYNYTYEYFTGAFNLITAAACLISLICAGFVALWKANCVTNDEE